MYKIGDLVNIVKPTTQNPQFHNWNLGCNHDFALGFEHEIVTRYLTDWYTLKPGADLSNIGFHESWLRPNIASQATVLLCVCPLPQLMNRGCLCGGFKKGA